MSADTEPDPPTGNPPTGNPPAGSPPASSPPEGSTAGSTPPDGVPTGDPPDSPPPAPDPGRRSVLTAFLCGTLGGGVIGSALPWPGLPGLASRTGQTRRNVAVYGGNDIDGARENALLVWELTPSTQRAQLRASYSNVGSRSTEQIDNVRNLLTRNATDLVVIDPQYLPELVGKQQLRRFDDVTVDSLTELGCFPGLVSQCTVDGTLYAVPLNADAPMLVINRALLGSAVQRRAAALANVTDPKAFWTEASAIAALATGASARTILLQNGDYEGMTVCLVELICAFGGDVSSDPALTSSRNRKALNELRTVFPKETFLPPANGKGDEEATVAALQQNAVAVARLWPAQCHGLTSGPPADEAKASEYLIIPVPGGVLGGQVAAIAAASPNSGAAEEAASFLAQPMSQLQLFSAAGYVPTLAQVHSVTSVKDELRSLGEQLDRAALRPSLRAYTPWSTQFTAAVRSYLLHTTNDLRTDVTRTLTPFAADA
jgi:ABC-type glycerol-3-phosphate transport system substrate-binding protein